MPTGRALRDAIEAPEAVARIVMRQECMLARRVRIECMVMQEQRELAATARLAPV